MHSLGTTFWQQVLGHMNWLLSEHSTWTKIMTVSLSIIIMIAAVLRLAHNKLYYMEQ